MVHFGILLGISNQGTLARLTPKGDATLFFCEALDDENCPPPCSRRSDAILDGERDGEAVSNESHSDLQPIRGLD
ncbi:hypothetical protein RE6C_04352 [Rhodopirellula europaea 6C]|uniref:Uncharacterized protein n=1 Tax=Rhodopirellula europaea 6C TaxID=1263867 RepID=M2AY26_9BACT|nr:hypothetical protein RE6C_04352 [Rhodopirellula europaea 6C]